jgi:hypothetical protein
MQTKLMRTKLTQTKLMQTRTQALVFGLLAQSMAFAELMPRRSEAGASAG